MENFETTVKRRKEKSFAKKQKGSMRIDMTPMVDLGFLLITFFVFTTTVSNPTVTDLFMPKDEKVIDSSQLPNSLALTFLLTEKNKIFYYNGEFNEAVKANKIFETNFSEYMGIGKVIRDKQKAIEESKKFKEGKNGLMLLIKPAKDANYKNLVDALDEVIINDIKKYAIVEPDKKEVDLLQSRSGQ